jgi:sensor histidine kinase YesM
VNHRDKTGQHIGIWNIRRRLKLFYGEGAVLSITSAAGEGTQVWIELPSGRADHNIQIDERLQP